MQITVNGKPLVVSDSKKNLHTLLAEGGIRLNAPCGGNGRCGKCRVRIANAPEPTAAERARFRRYAARLNESAQQALVATAAAIVPRRRPATKEGAAHVAFDS